MTRAPKKRGRFITLEGGEGTGKSTQSRRLAAFLEQHGLEVVQTREPGGSPGAEILRHVLLSGGAEPFGPEAETMLFAAARRDHLAVTILPALARGAWVVCDRFADSTRVYQGHAGKVPLDFILALEKVTVGENRPDLTLILDLPAKVGLARAAGRGVEADRFEKENLAFHNKLRQGFRSLARTEPERCKLVDAGADADTVAEAIRGIVRDRFGLDGRLVAP